MKRIFWILILIIVLLSSCEQKEAGLVPVCLSFGIEKGFSGEDSDSFSYWFKAVPEDGEHAYGGVTNWTEITVVDNSANIGYFSQGKWTFYVEKRGQNGSLYEGSSDCFVVKTALLNINVFLRRINVGSSFEELFSVSCPCSNPQQCQINCSYMKAGNPSWEVFGNWARTCETDKAVFTNKKDLTEGYYIFRFSYYVNDVQTGGETFAMYLDKEQVISGEIASVLNISDDAIVINNVTEDITAKAGSVKTFVCNGVLDFYKWYVNGILQEGCSSSVFSLTVNDGQTYNVKCSTSSGDKTCKVVAKTATKVYWDQYVLLAKDADYICRGFKLKGTDDSQILPKDYVASSEKESGYTLDDLGLEPVIISSYEDVLLADTVIIGKNAVLLNLKTDGTVNTNKNWLGMHKINDGTNTNVKTVYVFQNTTKECFRKMTGIENLYISATELGDNSFVSLTGLKNVYLSDDLKKIGAYAFDKCTGLVTITIPKSVTYVGTTAFRECSNLVTIYLECKSTSGWSTDWKKTCNAVTVYK